MLGTSRPVRSYLLALAFAAMAAASAVGQVRLPGLGAPSETERKAGDPVTITSSFTPPAAGQPAALHVHAAIQEGYHVYSVTQKSGGPSPTKIKVNDSPDYRVTEAFAPDRQPKTHFYEQIWPGLPVEEHTGEVTWSAPVELSPGVDPAALEITGLVDLQACDAGSCIPLKLPFTAHLQPVSKSPTPPAPGAQGGPPAAQDDVSAAQGFPPLSTVALELLIGLLSGFILNFMPCVLPVVGLKIMSFVQQAGHDRRHVLALNIWYSAGIIAVFMVLAVLAVVAKFAWGEQFGSTTFNVTLTAIVFVLALSLLGVWEIPIPGFVSTGKAHDLAAKEGPSAAFLKGVLTTILATPCTAPVMGTALSWAVQQRPSIVYAFFFSMGLGMSLPYVVVGAKPELLRILPKPGMWMVTFKQVMGFVLLGTVVFMLTYLYMPMVVPTAALLAGLGAACWWIGRIPYTAEPAEKAVAWAQAVAFAALAGILAFAWLPLPGGSGGLAAIMEHRFENEVARVSGQNNQRERAANELAWQPFSPERLADLQRAQKTVMVDFTADWCLICKTLEATVLNTSEVKGFVEQRGIVPLVADFTHKPPHIKQMLTELGSNGVPVLAIFPSDNPAKPIVLRGGYTQAQLLAALEEATAGQQTAAAQPAALPATQTAAN